MKKMITIMAIILIVNSCSTINNSIHNILLDNDEIEIYELLIDSFLERRNGNFVVIKEETTIPSLRLYSRNNRIDEKEFVLTNFGNEYSDLFNIFWENNMKKYNINSFIESYENYITYNNFSKIMNEYINENNLKGIDAYFWTVYRKLDINIRGIITLSRIGFNNEKNEALLQIEYLFGDLGLEIDYVILKKTDKWEIIKQRHYIMG
jgi:hypothetical protein